MDIINIINCILTSRAVLILVTNITEIGKDAPRTRFEAGACQDTESPPDRRIRSVEARQANRDLKLLQAFA
jgi:hypothetical protein